MTSTKQPHLVSADEMNENTPDPLFALIDSLQKLQEELEDFQKVGEKYFGDLQKKLTKAQRESKNGKGGIKWKLDLNLRQ